MSSDFLLHDEYIEERDLKHREGPEPAAAAGKIYYFQQRIIINQIPGGLAGTISVLFVDDESSLLDISKLYLEQTEEFTVTTASSALAGLDLLKSNGIQAIVSDYQMPEMDGIEFLKKVRSRDKNIPFILFTGRGREEIAIEAFENGADFYLQKGGDPGSQFAELVHKIRAAVKQRKADAQVVVVNRLYAVMSATNKAITRIHDKTELLNEICRIVVETGGFAMAWAGLVNAESGLIEPVASAGGRIEGFPGLSTMPADDAPGGQNPAVTAFHKRLFKVCNDIERDPATALWRKEALVRGYRSLAAFPFALNTENAGVITFYATEPGFFTDQIIGLLEEQSGDISFALETIEHEKRRIAAEENLKQSELRYRRLFETAQDAILILDGETGEIIDANRFIIDLLGYPLGYFTGKHLWDLGFIRDKTIAQKAFTKLKTNGYIRYDDIPLETRDGESMEVEFISNAYLVSGKKIIQCNIRDITARKTIQDALQASETRYRRLFETAQDGILIIDEETGKIIDANRFIIDLLGYPLGYFTGKHLWDLGFIRDKTITQSAFTALKTKGYIRYEEIPLETKSGKRIDVEFISNVYPVNNHKIIQCNIRDITDRKRAEAAFQQANKKLNLLSGITRHDIRNQLLALNGYLEISKKYIGNAVKMSEFVATEEGIARTIGRQIAFTQEYEAIGVSSPVWQDCRALVGTVAKQVPSGHLTVRNDLPAGAEVFADPLIVKVFLNLMDNAVRYGGTITTIRFYGEERDGDHVIVCEDDGRGVPAGEKERIFERGYGKNTGMGLYLSREILSITGITIRENGEPGKGARFEMTVPNGNYRNK